MLSLSATRFRGKSVIEEVLHYGYLNAEAASYAGRDLGDYAHCRGCGPVSEHVEGPTVFSGSLKQ